MTFWVHSVIMNNCLQLVHCSSQVFSGLIGSLDYNGLAVDFGSLSCTGFSSQRRYTPCIGYLICYGSLNNDDFLCLYLVHFPTMGYFAKTVHSKILVFWPRLVHTNFGLVHSKVPCTDWFFTLSLNGFLAQTGSFPFSGYYPHFWFTRHVWVFWSLLVHFRHLISAQFWFT